MHEAVGVERVDQQPVGHLGGHRHHLRPEATDQDPRHAEGVGARVERGRHQRVGGELAAEVELLPGLPAPQHRVRGLHDLPHAGDRTCELGAVALLDVRPDLAAEPQPEAPLREQLEVVGLVREVHGAAGERDGHVGHEVEVGAAARREDQRHEDVVRALEREGAVEPHLGELAGPARHIAEVVGIETGVDRDVHAVTLSRRQFTAPIPRVARASGAVNRGRGWSGLDAADLDADVVAGGP